MVEENGPQADEEQSSIPTLRKAMHQVANDDRFDEGDGNRIEISVQDNAEVAYRITNRLGEVVSENVFYYQG